MNTRCWKRLLVLWAMATLVSSAHATTVTLTPAEDTFVYNLDPSSNYGGGDTLGTGNSVSGNNLHLYRSFLKFDLAAVPDDQSVTAALLHMYQNNGAGFISDSGTDVAYVEGDSWDELTLNWDNQPAYGDVLGSCPDDKGHRGWSQWNLLANDQWNWSDDLADDVLSLAVNETGGSSTHNWYSKDYTQETLHPYLELTYIPEPATLIALLAGGWLMRRRACARK